MNFISNTRKSSILIYVPTIYIFFFFLNKCPFWNEVTSSKKNWKYMKIEFFILQICDHYIIIQKYKWKIKMIFKIHNIFHKLLSIHYIFLNNIYNMILMKMIYNFVGEWRQTFKYKQKIMWDTVFSSWKHFMKILNTSGRSCGIFSIRGPFIENKLKWIYSLFKLVLLLLFVKKLFPQMV